MIPNSSFSKVGDSHDPNQRRMNLGEGPTLQKLTIAYQINLTILSPISPTLIPYRSTNNQAPSSISLPATKVSAVKTRLLRLDPTDVVLLLAATLATGTAGGSTTEGQ